MQNSYSLVAWILKSKYFFDSTLLKEKLSANFSFIWKSFMAFSALIKEGACWRIGNG